VRGQRVQKLQRAKRVLQSRMLFSGSNGRNNGHNQRGTVWVSDDLPVSRSRLLTVGNCWLASIRSSEWSGCFNESGGGAGSSEPKSSGS
jgi:hypothetical protein